MDDPLDDALGLEPLPRKEANITVPATNSDDTDYEFARENMYRLTGKIEQSIDELSEIAYISQHPRAYEVLANLYKTGVEANKEILGLKKVHHSMDPRSNGPTTLNQTLVMTTDEVLQMLKDKR
jgi:hypothetical protein